MTVTFKQLIDALDQLYPPSLAEDWDRIGLHFGDPNARVNRVMTCLDVRHSVIDEAIENRVDTLIVHHPLLFHPIKRFDLSDRQTQLYARLIQADIKVFAIHTNLDAANNGMNDWLAAQLGLENIRSLEVKEDSPGIGRIGDLPRPMTRSQVLEHIKKVYGRTQLPIIEKQIRDSYQTIGLVGGAGTSYAQQALEGGAHIFLTGDISYHSAQGLEDLDLMTIDVGHYTENIFAREASQVINQLAQAEGWDLLCLPSSTNINPFTYE